MIFGELIATSTQRLSDAGCASPQWDAEALVMHAFGLTRTDLIFARRDEVPDGPAFAELERLLARREAREPLQHILGTAPMMGLELQVGPGVFVPRPETELLAQWAIDQARGLIEAGVRNPKIVDFCTGSGALALAIADAVPETRVIGVELDPKAFEWAQDNLSMMQKQWGSGSLGNLRDVRIISGDVTDLGLLTGSQDQTKSCDLADWIGLVDIVVSNPPYVPESTEVSAEVRVDPHHAVFGGDDGLEVIRPMMKLVNMLLRDGGVVGIEHDDDSGDDMIRLLGETWGYESVECHPDLAGRDRFSTATKRATE